MLSWVPCAILTFYVIVRLIFGCFLNLSSVPFFFCITFVLFYCPVYSKLMSETNSKHVGLGNHCHRISPTVKIGLDQPISSFLHCVYTFWHLSNICQYFYFISFSFSSPFSSFCFSSYSIHSLPPTHSYILSPIFFIFSSSFHLSTSSFPKK